MDSTKDEMHRAIESNKEALTATISDDVLPARWGKASEVAARFTSS